MENGRYFYIEFDDNDQGKLLGSIDIQDDKLAGIVTDTDGIVEHLFSDNSPPNKVIQSINSHGYATILPEAQAMKLIVENLAVTKAHADQQENAVKPEWQSLYMGQNDGTDRGMEFNPDHHHPLHGSIVNDIPLSLNGQPHKLHENDLPDTQAKIKLLELGHLAYNPERGYHLANKFVDKADGKPMMKAELGRIGLVHFSRQKGLKTLEPKKIGTGHGASRQEKNAEVPRTYYYRSDSAPEAHVESGAASKYTSSIDPSVHRLYDLGLDPENHIEGAMKENNNAWNTDMILNRIKKAGYHGFFNSNGALPGVIGLFYPHPTETETDING
jgi:hypothetical protein